MTPIYTAFFTLGTLYEREADRLRRSLDRLSLDHDLRGVEDLGDWSRNAALTAEHIDRMLSEYPDRPVVQLDADAVVWRRPVLFDNATADVMIHRRRGVEWLNGTIYFAPTAAARLVASRYLELIRANPGCTNEQLMLGKAIEELAGRFTLGLLPASYTFIPDIMAADLADREQVTISHFQASRQMKHVGGEAESRRAKWIEEWEGLEAQLSA